MVPLDVQGCGLALDENFAYLCLHFFCQEEVDGGGFGSCQVGGADTTSNPEQFEQDTGKNLQIAMSCFPFRSV